MTRGNRFSSPELPFFFPREMSDVGSITYKDPCSSYDPVTFAGSLLGGTRSQGHPGIWFHPQTFLLQAVSLTPIFSLIVGSI